MKKALGVIISFLLLLSLGTTSVYAEPAIISTINGSVGAQGTWDSGQAKEAAGDSLKIYYQGDTYGYYFDEVPAGVYKIGFYITADSLCFGKRIRVSPRVNVSGTELRCWIDWSTSDTLQILSDAVDDEKGKLLLVSVINIPADGALIDVGFWQDSGAYIGTLDKIVLASADYDFKDNEYVLIGEKSYGDRVFTEDPGAQLLAPEGSWTVSASYEDAVTELGPVATETPANGATPTVIPSETQDTTVTPAPTATSTPNASDATEKGGLPVWAILVIVIVLAIGAGAGGAVLSLRKKKK